jgi:transcriptional regulator with XRE-family HTH domain
MTIKKRGRGQGASRVLAKPKLRIERISRGYTLEQFSKMIGYSAAGYGKTELGRNGITPRGVGAILKVLDMEFDDLFEFVEVEDSSHVR